MDGRKEVEAIVRQAKAKGWIVEKKTHGYAIAPPGSPKDFVYMGSTPSDTRALKNMLARLKRRGWEDNGQKREYTPEEIHEQLEAEVAGLKEERDLLWDDGVLYMDRNEKLEAQAVKLRAEANRANGELAARDTTISKMRGQVESWRQESHKWKGRTDECVVALVRLAKEAGVPDEGPDENVTAALAKLEDEKGKRREVVSAFKSLQSDVNHALNEVGAPMTTIRDGQEVRLTVEERILSLSGGAAAAAFKLKLEHFRDEIAKVLEEAR